MGGSVCSWRRLLLEYLFDNPWYIGKDHFIMRRIGIPELQLDANVNVVMAYNKMHVEYHVKVKWGISGFKKSGDN